MDVSIPRNGVELRNLTKELLSQLAQQQDKDNLIKAVAFSTENGQVPPAPQTTSLERWRNLFYGTNETQKSAAPLSPMQSEERSTLVDILIEGRDSQIIPLCSRYREDVYKFKQHALSILRERSKQEQQVNTAKHNTVYINPAPSSLNQRPPDKDNTADPMIQQQIQQQQQQNNKFNSNNI